MTFEEELNTLIKEAGKRLEKQKLHKGEKLYNVEPFPLSKNILEEANKITQGDRQKDYGTPKENFEHIAEIFNSIRGFKKLSAEDVVYVMLAVKLSRHQNKKKRDNLVDIAGYTWVLSEVEEK